MVQLLLVFILMMVVNGSIYMIDENAQDIPLFIHAEKMYAKNDAPFLAQQNDAYVKVELRVGKTLNRNVSMKIVNFVVDSHQHMEIAIPAFDEMACSETSVQGLEGILDQNMTEMERIEDVAFRYEVKVSGWVVVQIYLCGAWGNFESGVETVTGKVEVKNAHGYLPAPLYGLYLFSRGIWIGYLGITVAFIAQYVRFRSESIKLHGAILMILTLGCVSSGYWYISLNQMNEIGTPVCCPFPTLYFTYLMMDAFMRTAARGILLIVALGYGIVRTKLRLVETVGVMVLSLLYGVFAVLEQVHLQNQTAAHEREKPSNWAFMELICNMIFVMWIYSALENIIKDLKEQKQSGKLNMYKSLANALGVFTVIFTLLTLISASSQLGIISWPVEWKWIHLVSWPMLNFTVASSISYIWRPTTSSSQLAFSTQLATSEEDFEKQQEEDDEDDEFRDTFTLEDPDSPESAKDEPTSL